jgi:1,4-dihydroxy-2-naphthoyl-CoA hydrolase
VHKGKNGFSEGSEKMGRDESLKVPSLRPEWTLDIMKEQCKGYLPDLIGMEVVSVIPGKLSSRLMVRHDLMAPNGFLHAATIIGLADTTCGFGTLAHLPEGAVSFTTIELKTNFLGTIREGVIACEAQLEHFGQTLQVWGAEVITEAINRRIALFRCTQMILWPKVRVP